MGKIDRKIRRDGVEDLSKRAPWKKENGKKYVTAPRKSTKFETKNP
jgi:hypothetical protein